MNGWIRLHRQILDWEWYSCPYTKSLFIHLLLKASWRDARWQGMEIPSGSLFCSVETLSAATGLSTRRVRTALERLKSTGEVTSQTTSRGTLLTLCKWEDYNGDDDDSDKPNDKPSDKRATNERQASDKQATTSKEGKEGKKVKPGAFEIPQDLPKHCQEALADWQSHRREIRKPISPTQWGKLVADFRSNPDIMTAAVHKSVLSGWHGLFPDKVTPGEFQPAAKPKPQGPPANWREMAAKAIDRDVSSLEYHNLTDGEKSAIDDAIRNA